MVYSERMVAAESIKSSTQLTYLVIIFLAVVIGLLFFIFPYEDKIGWLGLAVGFLLILFLGLKQPRLWFLLVAAYFLRAGSAILNYYFVSLPDTKYDAATFEQFGWQ